MSEIVTPAWGPMLGETVGMVDPYAVDPDMIDWLAQPFAPLRYRTRPMPPPPDPNGRDGEWRDIVFLPLADLETVPMGVERHDFGCGIVAYRSRWVRVPCWCTLAEALEWSPAEWANDVV